MKHRKDTAEANARLRTALEGARQYRRRRHLPALLALWPSQLDDFSAKGTREIIHRLKAALLAERRRGRARHWCYNLNRHMALVSALEGERNHLARLSQKQTDETTDATSGEPVI